MRKFYSIVKCLVFIAFSLNWLRADLLLNDENIEAIDDLSKKESFQVEDIERIFSLFTFKSDENHHYQVIKEIRRILQRKKKYNLEYEFLAKLQKILVKILIYDIEHLDIYPVKVDLAERCFLHFNKVLDEQDRILIRSAFYKKKADFFKAFIKNYEAEIIKLSKKREFNKDLVCQCFRLFLNEDVGDFISDQVYRKCINVLIGLIATETSSNSFKVLVSLQKILKNLQVFYMQQFDELPVKSFCFKFKDLLMNVLMVLPKEYKTELRELFYRLLKDSHRIELTPKEEIDFFDNLDESIYAIKNNCFLGLQNFEVLKENLKILPSASVYLDRFPYSPDCKLNKFIFFSGKQEKGIFVPEIHCFLSLENKDVDLTAFSVRLYNNKDSVFLSDGINYEKVFLYSQIEDNKFHCLKEIKVCMLSKVDALRIPNSEILEPSFNELTHANLFQEKANARGLFKVNKKIESKDLTVCNEDNLFCCLFWQSCLQERNAEVQHVLTNYSLGVSGIGDKFLHIKDSISREKQEKQLEIRVHVFATDELLFKALQNFAAKQEQQFPKSVFLDYNEKKECFELLNVEQHQTKKGAILGKLEQKWEILKQGDIVNRQKIEELMGKLLKQRKLETEKLDMSIVQEVEFLLENEEEISKLSLVTEEIFAKNEKEVGILKWADQEVEDSRRDFWNRFKVLKQKYLELEKQYRQLQENSKGAKLSDSETWERLQAQRNKNEEDWEEFQQQEREHERAWKLYKEQVRGAQEAEQKRQAELRRQQEEAERIRKAEEEQRRREEETRRPKGFTGQQIVDRTKILVQGSPMKVSRANQMVRFKRIQPGTTYLNLSQLDPFFHEAFKSLEKGNK